MNAVVREFMKAAKESPRLYFAPIVGAVDAVRGEMSRLAGAKSDRVQTQPEVGNTEHGGSARR